MSPAICVSSSLSEIALKCQFCPFIALGAFIPALRIVSMSPLSTASSVKYCVVAISVKSDRLSSKASEPASGEDADPVPADAASPAPLSPGR